MFTQGVVRASTGLRICTQSVLESHIRTDSQTHCGSQRTVCGDHNKLLCGNGLFRCCTITSASSLASLPNPLLQRPVQPRNALQHAAMSTSRASVTQDQKTTLLSSFTERLLTPPPTDEKQLPQVSRVLALFKRIQTGRHSNREPWIGIQFFQEDYDETEHRLQQDKALLGFVKDQIRWVDPEYCRTCR